MGTKIIIILACVPLYVINSFCDKVVSTKKGSAYNYIYNCVKFFFCSICMVPMLFLETPSAMPLSGLICGISCGLMYSVSKTVMLKGYETTSVAFMTLCHSSGMILPCVLGYFLWSEKLSLLSIVGIFITIMAIVLLKDNKTTRNRFKTKDIIFGLIIFLTSGGVMITQKVMGIYFKEQGVTLYTFYSFIVPTLILFLLSKPQSIKNINRQDKKTITFCALGSAISLSVISLVMTRLASNVPSVILFPLFNGFGIIAVCIGSVFAFKEKLNTKNIVGLILGVLGLCITNLR